MSGSSSLNSVSLTINSIGSQSTTITSVICPSFSSRQISPITTISSISSKPSSGLKYTLHEFQNPLNDIMLTNNSYNYLKNQLINENTIKNDNYSHSNRSSSHELHKNNNNKNYSSLKIQYNKSCREQPIDQTLSILKSQKLEEKIYANLTLKKFSEISTQKFLNEPNFHRSLSRSPLSKVSEDKLNLKLNNQTHSSNSIQLSKKPIQQFNINLEDQLADKTLMKSLNQTKEKKNKKRKNSSKKEK